MLRTMLLAMSITRSISLQLAVFAEELLLLRLLFDVQLLGTVDHTSEVGLFALETLVERAGMHCEAEQISIVCASR